MNSDLEMDSAYTERYKNSYSMSDTSWKTWYFQYRATVIVGLHFKVMLIT